MALPSLSLRIFHEIYQSIYLSYLPRGILENCAWPMKTLGREDRKKSGNSPLPQGIHPVNLRRYDRITLLFPSQTCHINSKISVSNGASLSRGIAEEDFNASFILDEGLGNCKYVEKRNAVSTL